jgi:hypothetical protein
MRSSILSSNMNRSRKGRLSMFMTFSVCSKCMLFVLGLTSADSMVSRTVLSSCTKLSTADLSGRPSELRSLGPPAQDTECRYAKFVKLSSRFAGAPLYSLRGLSSESIRGPPVDDALSDGLDKTKSPGLAVEAKGSRPQVEVPGGDVVGYDDRQEVFRQRVGAQSFQQAAVAAAVLVDELGGRLTIARYPSDVCQTV